LDGVVLGNTGEYWVPAGVDAGEYLGGGTGEYLRLGRGERGAELTDFLIGEHLPIIIIIIISIIINIISPIQTH
jgi:hypothetical protein